MRESGGRFIRSMATSVLILALADCTSQGSPTAAPSSPAQSSAHPPVPSASSAGPSAALGTSAPSFAPFDPNSVSVTLQPYATVEGGPLAITAPLDGTGRLFVASQDGRAWVIRNGSVVATPLLDLRGQITSGGERGLLGLAVHPGFPADPRVFVDYTDLQGNTVVASYTIDASNPDRLDPASAKTILQVGQPYANHNGGQLGFGPDGDLYISLGDGGSGGDPQGNGQKLDTTLGKILRIDVDHSANGLAYAIPSGNPFAGNPLAHPEIWLYGLRNPWRFSFDPATNDLWIGDVGQGNWEEIDVDPAGVGGLNYGWNRMEGDHCYQPSTGCDESGITLPVAEYDHSHGCAVIGGVVDRDPGQPILQGAYLYSDNCSGIIWALDADAAQPSPAQVGQTDPGIAAFGVDQAGAVYAANLNGTISRVAGVAR
ncbi:MAG TPA: PQQ-dependent sugar dehydrogenase [Candidatus Limnocylindrales bacterium]|nr:PQQ-dependent sugar dehydrogenase [Candidatus Limnocylindrales bacterium]